MFTLTAKALNFFLFFWTNNSVKNEANYHFVEDRSPLIDSVWPTESPICSKSEFAVGLLLYSCRATRKFPNIHCLLFIVLNKTQYHARIPLAPSLLNAVELTQGLSFHWPASYDRTNCFESDSLAWSVLCYSGSQWLWDHGPSFASNDDKLHGFCL